MIGENESGKRGQNRIEGREKGGGREGEGRETGRGVGARKKK